MNIVYKVCWRPSFADSLYNESVVENKYYSVCQNAIFKNVLRVEYKVGEWATPCLYGSKLFAFSNLYDARGFRYGFLSENRFRIFKAEAIGVSWPRITRMPNIEDIEKFWNAKTQHKRISNFTDGASLLASGTVWCNAIKLLEEVN